MPGDDGLTALRRLRDAGDDLPVVMLTARGDGVDRIIGLEQGADDYLAKPFLPRELSARIEAVLRRRSSIPAGTPLAEGGDVMFGSNQFDLPALMTAGTERPDLAYSCRTPHLLLAQLTTPTPDSRAASATSTTTPASAPFSTFTVTGASGSSANNR